MLSIILLDCPFLIDVKMKKRIFAIMIFTLLCVSCSRTKQLQKHATKAHIEFNKGQHDFGTIIWGDPAECEFSFVNTGADTLIINEVQTTCGCTIPQWSQEPVPPKGKGAIRVSYDSRRSGEFEKGITVFSNADNSAILLVIRGKVTSNPNKFIIGGKKDSDSTSVQKNSEVEHKNE